MLFIELSLIRWLGANLVHLAYFSNFVLLGSFLGVGLGFLRAARENLPPKPQPYYSLVVLIGLIGFVSAYPVTVDRQSTQVVFFTNISTSGPPIWLVLPAVFLSVAAVCAGPAEIVVSGVSRSTVNDRVAGVWSGSRPSSSAVSSIARTAKVCWPALRPS